MFKSSRKIVVLSMLLLLAGIFFIVFSRNEISRTADAYDESVSIDFNILWYNSISVSSNVPVTVSYQEGDTFSVNAVNVNPEYFKSNDTPSNGLQIDYFISEKNMDSLFVPLISFTKEAKPEIIITVPTGYELTNGKDKGHGYSFNLLAALQSSKYLVTSISFDIIPVSYDYDIVLVP